MQGAIPQPCNGCMAEEQPQKRQGVEQVSMLSMGSRQHPGTTQQRRPRSMMTWRRGWHVTWMQRLQQTSAGSPANRLALCYCGASTGEWTQQCPLRLRTFRLALAAEFRHEGCCPHTTMHYAAQSLLEQVLS